MDIALLLSTFFTVFLAELGDKTQLATVAISGTSNRPLAVFIGSSSALVIASLIGALAGGSMANVVPADLLQLIEGNLAEAGGRVPPVNVGVPLADRKQDVKCAHSGRGKRRIGHRGILDIH